MEEELPRRLDELEAVGVGNNKMKERKARERRTRSIVSNMKTKRVTKLLAIITTTAYLIHHF